MNLSLLKDEAIPLDTIPQICHRSFYRSMRNTNSGPIVKMFSYEGANRRFKPVSDKFQKWWHYLSGDE